ncbi:hypothetical protein HY971_02180, partial [Candidatus Kaiserbacteria bacterium]|nr:hypothetical protein [Candidatus Kaiserbacteria bacterium]
TTSLFAGTNGQILAFSGGTWTGVATTTFSTGLTYASGNTTCDTASDSVFGCLTSASFSKFNSATTTFTNGLSYSAGAASLAAIAANSILANVTGASAVPTALATSSFFSLTGATTITYASSTAITSSGSGYFATSGGSVGVGTTSPWGLLSVNPSGISGPAFAIGSSTMTQFVVTNGSNVGNSNLVGVGTTSPWATFAIEQQASTTASFVVSDSGTSTPFLLVDGKGNIGLGTSTPYGLLTLYKTGSTAAASPQLVFSASSTISGVGNFLNNWAVGTDFNDGGKFKISSSSVIGTNDRFVIDGSGNVGIGTTTPWSNVNSVGSTLDLTSSGVVRLSMHDTAGTQEGSITANNAGLNLRVAGAATASNNIITFWTGNTNSDFTMSERMRIDSAGNIGIGTTTPQWLLNPFSATASQLALSAGAGIGQWAFRNAGGNFYLASTTADGTATSTTALFSITNASTTIANALYSGSLATSSFANGVNLTGGCFSINGTCVGGGGSGTVTSIATNDGLTGGTITTSGTIGLAAIAANSILANVTGASAVPTALATSSFFSLTGATTITYASSTATSVSGTASSTFGNIGTLTLTTDLSVANGGTGASTLTGLLQGNGTSAFTAITDSSTAGQVLRVTGASTYAWGALDLADTDAVTGDLPFSNLAQVSANSILGNITGSTGDAASISTSSLFAAGTAGNVLTYTTAGTWVPSATTTFSTGLTYASGNTTCDTASASVFGCLTSASFSKFNSATTTFTNGLSYSAGAASLSAIAANSILANVTGASAVPTALATSSFFSLTGATTITYASSTAITSSGSAYFATSGGSVGIGTTSPFRLLSMTSAVSTAQQAIAYDTANNTDILTSSVGDYFVYPSGDDALFNDSNLWVCTGGSGNTNGCPTGTPTTNGNLLVETRVGIATSTPRWELQVAGTRPSIAISDSNAAANLKHWTLSSQNGNLYFATSTDAYATSTIAAITVNSNGWVGIGTTTPSRELSTSGRLYVAAGGASGMGTATSTFQGDIKIVGKLDVGTIDPVYTIDGVKYATYGDSTIGIHEEVLQAITLSERGVNGKYSYTIDFDTLETGSDLWLFYQITDFGEDWKTLIVALTPGFDATVYYKKVPKENKLIIESSAPGEVSMRLSGNRFDFTKWGNLRTDQEDKSYKGFEINSKPVTISPAQSGTESAAQIATP